MAHRSSNHLFVPLSPRRVGGEATEAINSFDFDTFWCVMQAEEYFGRCNTFASLFAILFIAERCV